MESASRWQEIGINVESGLVTVPLYHPTELKEHWHGEDVGAGKRGRLDVMADMLECMLTGCIQLRLMQSCNLSQPQMHRWLRVLSENKLVELRASKMTQSIKGVFFTTNEGRVFLSLIRAAQMMAREPISQSPE